jgi:hypothetical protein
MGTSLLLIGGIISFVWIKIYSASSAYRLVMDESGQRGSLNNIVCERLGTIRVSDN